MRVNLRGVGKSNYLPVTPLSQEEIFDIQKENAKLWEILLRAPNLMAETLELIHDAIIEATGDGLIADYTVDFLTNAAKEVKELAEESPRIS